MTAPGNRQLKAQPDPTRMWAAPDQDFAGIRRLELPLPFRPGSVNVYLVPQEDGWILVDCGVDVPDVLSTYEMSGIRWSGIRQIVLTHVHPDHSGLSARLRQLTGAPVSMHRNEQEVLGNVREPEPWIDWQNSILRDAGVPRDLLYCIRDATRELRSFYPAVAADSYIESGQVIPTAAGPMRALLTPGHSPGHLCFYFPEKRILLGGDHLLRPGSPHIEWYSGGSALQEFRASLQALAPLNVEWVLPSHGRAFNGYSHRIAGLLEHTHDMDQKIEAMRARGVESPHRLASAAWRVPLPPFEHRNAVFEVLAYLQSAAVQ